MAKTSKAKKNVKKNSSRGSKITMGKPVDEAFLGKYFNLFSHEQILEFDAWYQKLEKKLVAMKMDAESMMMQITEAYRRYLNFKELDAFTPMDKKGLKYVKSFIFKAIENTYKSLGKSK